MWDYAILFLSSFSLMTYEIVVSRMLAPYIGSSSLVWSGIIGFVMLGMTIGYYVGGTIRSREIALDNIAVASFIFLVLTFFYPEIFLYVQGAIINPRFMVIVLTAVAVGPIAYLIATLSPFLVSEIVAHSDNTNTSISRAYMVGSLGAILGTFSSTFVFIPHVSIPIILLGMAIVFMILLLPYKRHVILVIMLIIVALLGSLLLLRKNTNVVFATESLYNSIEVKDELRNSGELVRRLYMDKTIQSEMSLEDPFALASPYVQYYNLPFAYVENPQRFLMIGGGAYSYPKYFAKNYPKLSMNVVEIDPKVTQIAKDFFSFRETENMTVYTQDARVYMNNTSQTYDAILMDAFNGYSTPAHLATREYAHLVYETLGPDGVLVINIPGSLTGDYDDFLLSQYKMYKELFPYVDLYTALFNDKPESLQNIMLVARKSRNIVDYAHLIKFEKNKFQGVLDIDDVIVLIDAYSPTDFLNRKFDTYFNY